MVLEYSVQSQSAVTRRLAGPEQPGLQLAVVQWLQQGHYHDVWELTQKSCAAWRDRAMNIHCGKQ